MYIETQFCSDFPINPIPYLSSKYPDPAVFGCISATAGLGVLRGARWGAHSARPPEKRKGHRGRLDTLEPRTELVRNQPKLILQAPRIHASLMAQLFK